MKHEFIYVDEPFLLPVHSVVEGHREKVTDNLLKYIVNLRRDSGWRWRLFLPSYSLQNGSLNFHSEIFLVFYVFLTGEEIWWLAAAKQQFAYDGH